MIRKISIGLVALLLIQSVSDAFVEREITVRCEKTIPFNFTSSSMYLEEDLSIRGLKNVEIKDVYIDNGSVDVNISGNYIELDFNNGEIFEGKKEIIKTESFSIEDAIVDKDNTIIIETNHDINTIKEVSGDFYTAKANKDGDIIVTLKDDAIGENGYDENTLEKSRFIVNVKEDNKDRYVISDKVSLLHKPVGDVTPVSGDTSSIHEIVVDENDVKVVFDNGVPIANEITSNYGYTYCWVDRDENGKFRIYKPNSIYSTDINKITGLGEYLDYSDFDEIGMTFSDKNWEDYCGVNVNGKRYVYTYDKNKGIPKELEADIIDGDSITFNEQNLNSEKYAIKFRNADVSYIPEGKLYSMGALVEGTLGWGEVYPNNEDESKKSFFNELTGKYETYVKHFKFFYGPQDKKVFGGYYTYPYSCEFEYEHYKPVKYYSGEVVYSYNDVEDVSGYLYNGWIKISYEQQKIINDYPPTAPLNVKYNPETGKITWGAGSDDYTENGNLIYEIETYLNGWKLYKKTNEGVNEENCSKNLSNDAVRIRTVDEVGQVSEWTYAKDFTIELQGSINPYIVKPGEKVNISAVVKSFFSIDSVIAENDELNINSKLDKISEDSPDFFEMSYDLEADFPDSSADYIVIGNGMNALGSKNDFETTKFRVSEKFDESIVKAELVEDVKFNKNGTLIFSNQNYLTPPLNMFRYNNKYWFLNWESEIKVLNKLNNKAERFILVESVAKSTLVENRYVYVPKTQITVNTFNYNSSGKPIYKIIEVDKNLIRNPFVVTWNTDVSGVTEFRIYFENELVYKYEANWEDINSHVDNFFSVDMYKRLKKYTMASYGYINASKPENIDWPKIVIGVAINRDLRNFLWLGYKVRKNEYLNANYVEEYNNNPKVRNNYRLFISDEELSDLAIKEYIKLLSGTNISMTSDKNTVWGDDVLQYTSSFEASNIEIPVTTTPGKYEILLTAKDVEGNTASTYLTLIVQGEEVFEEEDNKAEGDEELEKDAQIIDYKIGRFFYRDGNGYLEELKLTGKNIDTKGFICAGETLGIIIKAQNTEYIDIDFLGDGSIKIMDDLTEKFLIKNPEEFGKDVINIDKDYENFPLRIYPHIVDNLGNSEFKCFYIIPYKTKQSLESWSTLKSSTLEKIDKSNLFNRKDNYYEVVFYLNGDRKNCFNIKFDVFERWDTVLNRNVKDYIINSDTKWEMRVDK